MLENNTNNNSGIINHNINNSNNSMYNSHNTFSP